MLKLKNLLNCFNSPRTSSPQRPTKESFVLYKKDDQYYADPKSLATLDKFESHQAAAEELNAYRAQLQQVKGAVAPLEGTSVDKNERPDVVAVENLDVRGMTVDGVLKTHSETTSTLEARVEDGDSTIFMKEDNMNFTQYLDFQVAGRSYDVRNDLDESFVEVTRTEQQ
jgi:hypothetical protein